MTHDEILEVVQAHKDGKTIQERTPLTEIVDCKLNKTGEMPAGEWFDSKEMPRDFYRFEYRIKPEPKKRLIRVDELPDVIWLNSDCGRITIVSEIEGSRIYPSKNEEPLEIWEIKTLQKEGWFWSSSHKGPWKTFEVSE